MSYFDEETIAEAERGELTRARFCLIKTKEGPIGFWDFPGNITLNGVMYVGDGSLGQISGISEAEGLESSEVTVVLNGAIDAVRSVFMNATWHMRRAEVFCLLFSASLRVLHPAFVWRHVGLIEKAPVNQASGQEAAITLRLCDLNQRSKIGTSGYLTDGDQRHRLESDTILRNVASLGRATTNCWGKKLYQYGNQSVHGKSISG